MAHDKHHDQFITNCAPVNSKTAAQGAFWAARDAINSYVLAPTLLQPVGTLPIDTIVTTCKQLPEVTVFLELAGDSEMLQQLYKHWVNDAISSALKTYINSKS